MQGSKLYVGNLVYSMTEEELQESFSSHGEVEVVRVSDKMVIEGAYHFNCSENDTTCIRSRASAIPYYVALRRRLTHVCPEQDRSARENLWSN